MEFSYKVLKAHKNGLDVSKSKHGLNVSCALDMGSGKIIISLIGKFKNYAGRTRELGSFLNTSKFSWFNL